MSKTIISTNDGLIVTKFYGGVINGTQYDVRTSHGSVTLSSSQWEAIQTAIRSIQPTQRDIWNNLDDRVRQQDTRDPEGYPCTRDGMRLGIASLEDDLDQIWQEWNEHKHDGEFLTMKYKLDDVAAVAVRMMRSIMEDESRRIE